MKEDSLEGSAHTSMYNPNILPLILKLNSDTIAKLSMLLILIKFMSFFGGFRALFFLRKK